MEKVLSNKEAKEHGIIAKMIFKGYKVKEIASVLNYSRSTTQNRIKSLFKKYNAENRNDFMLNVIGEVMDKNKLLIAKQEKKIFELSQIIESLTKELKKYTN